MSKYNELVKKLKEIFQIDRPELDFGIYRILNSRADEINDYLDNKLKSKIQTALADAGNANKADLEQQLQAVIKATTEAGFEPDQSPKVQALKKQIAETATGASEHENAVFSHLLTFFSRYYDNGDFISKRRYKGDTYAIPYAGEEVMLHWANKDQYYIKSGENFANYAFKLDDGRKVSFKLLAADTAKDNRKDNDADRRFVLIEPHTRTKLDEDGEEFEQTYQPVEVVKSTEIINGESVVTEELVIHFEYKAMKKGTKQDALVQTAIATILSDSQVQQHWADLSKRAPTESNPNRTELERHLTTYTQRNTADYFIHKDLGGFLSNELDFYIKNEVMNLDNVQNAEVFANIEKQLRMIQCLRAVALELITFLAQIENFQKILWNKKKFVSNLDYLISLSKVSPELFGAILNNRAQYNEWVDLYNINKMDGHSFPLKYEFLKKNDGLVLDTKHFSLEFKQKLLSSFINIDEQLNGLLIHSDNYQALNFLQNKYSSSIDCLYIDPPYNTAASEILYKNEYKHSSWISLMYERLSKSYHLLKPSAINFTAIDHAEIYNLGKLKDQLYGEKNRIAIVTVQHNPKGRNQAKFFSENTEYMLVYAKDSNVAEFNSVAIDDEVLATFTEQDSISRYRWENFIRARSSWSRENRPNNWYPIYVSPDLKSITTEYKDGYSELFPQTSQGDFSWKNIKESFNELNKNGYFKAVKEDGSIKIYHKYREQQVFKNLWIDKKYQSEFNGTNLLKGIIGETLFDYPKSLYAVQDAIKMSTPINGIVLDYFAGSGTTAHAVINLNNQENANRKFINIEMGAHFDSVVVPRIKKIAFSNSWKNAKALGNSSDIFIKTLKLESYEDTLNNISLTKKNRDLFDLMSQEAAEDYLLKYMLGEESKNSLLNTDNFRKPFSYEMDIATDSAGATERKTIDLVETFNFLIGLHVKSIESNIERGFVRVEGTLPSGERTLILWRDCDKIGYEKLNEYANRFDLYAKEQTFDVIYINGDHNLPTAFTVDGNEGDVMRSLKLRQIEPEFLSLMFAEEI
ncbi:site-specific DNA-methyltransferase [Proteus mirabilis]|uniref:site-specific DNA-methyltransferase n=1 Tax=Proteus mirabilis TaxID=584 RepID=UPI0024BBAC86|nr:site-specific DNA-methyltransferase [Proteus mirabilis]